MKIKLYFLFFFLTQIASAQSQLPLSPEMQPTYQKGTRSLSGAPGPNYWQNTADYDLKVSFNPATREMIGIANITYTNSSPDTLNRLLFKLFPNLYKKDALHAMPIAVADLGDGLLISKMTINGNPVDNSNLITRGTNLSVRNIQVFPKQTSIISVEYCYIVNRGSFIRTGQIDSAAFFVAYFFPRIAVYDDVDGWNEYPYTGREEFYNDYGKFNAEITVPGDYQVWATGDLLNADEVYTSAIIKRLQLAAQSDDITDVITVADLASGSVTPHNKSSTWKFYAEHVTDFAFAVSNHYVWKASSALVDPATGRRTRVDAVYNPEHNQFTPVTDYTRNTVKAISYNFPHIPFPYSHQTIIDGLDAMEYPMMVNNLPFQSRSEVVEFTTHEVFHAIFPFFVGTNETKYAFMDEGWATLSEFLLYPLIDPEAAITYDISDVNNSAGIAQDVPVMTPTPQLYGKARYANKDLKPALAFLYLKEMLGDEVFLKALQHYIHTWQGKHPTPYDFFYNMNSASGINLNWFWNNWFFGKGIPDLAISSVIHKGTRYNITIRNVGTEVVPIHLKIIYTDNTEETLSKSIACWASGNSAVSLKFTTTRQVKEIILGTPLDADSNKGNNTWKPPAPKS